MYANKLGWTDVEPFEVIKKCTERKLTIRSMNCERDESWTPEWHVGGFAGHCSNQYDQKWFITPNEEGYTTDIRLGKDGVWKDKHGGKYKVSDTPYKFYDYNF